MATINLQTNYTGEFAYKYIAPALLFANSIRNGAFEVMENIPYKSNLKVMTMGDPLQNATCDFTDQGSIVLSDRVIEVKELQVNKDICYLPFLKDWEAKNVTGNGSRMNKKLPPEFLKFFMARLSEKIAESTELKAWNGDDAVAGSFTGFIPRIVASTDIPAAQKITIGASTVDTVLDVLGAVYQAIPNRLYNKEGMKMYISNNIMRDYIISLGGFGANGLGGAGFDNKGQMWYNGQPLNFGGIPLFSSNGIPDNKIVATYKENLFFGTSQLADITSMQLLDMNKTDGSDNLRVVMKMAAGTQIANPEDIVFAETL